MVYIFHRTSRIEQLVNNVNGLEVELLSQKNIRNDFIRIETINPDFFIKRQSKFVAANKKFQTEIQNNIGKLAKSEILGNKNPDIEKVVSRIKHNTLLNQFYFDSLCRMVLNRGFKDWGCEGRMRDCAHILETCKELNVVDVLQLRRREKDFIIRIQEQYIDSVRNIINKLNGSIQRNPKITRTRKREILYLTNCYLSNFNEIAKLELIMGIKNMKGISYIIQQQTDTIDRDFEILHKHTQKLKVDFYLEVFYSFIVLLIAFIIASFVICYRISRKITDPFNTLVHHIDVFIKTGFTDYQPIELKGETSDVRLLLDNFTMMQSEIVLYVNHFKEKVAERTMELEEHKNIIETQNTNIIDSINSAKNIQQSMLQDEDYIKRILPDSFILNLPKDIVSGDFYFVDWKWSESENAELLYVIAADATGHGVPGAFMSMLALSQIKSLFPIDMSPAKFLQMLNTNLYQHLHKNRKSDGNIESFENVDMAMCCINFNTMVLQFQGAKRPCYIVRNGTIHELKRDNISVGEHNTIQSKVRLQDFQLESGDTVYVFSDGFISQFGGKENKKFNIKKLKDLLIIISQHNINKQKDILFSVLTKWKGVHDQTDDV